MKRMLASTGSLAPVKAGIRKPLCDDFVGSNGYDIANDWLLFY